MYTEVQEINLTNHPIQVDQLNEEELYLLLRNTFDEIAISH